MIHIGAKIRAYRLKKGLTQTDLAKLMHISSHTSLSKLENGGYTPSVFLLKEYADALDVTIDKLLPEEWLSKTPAMTLNDYQVAAARTFNKKLWPEQMAQHALHGLVSELGEIHGLYQKKYQGHEIDKDHLKKEAGDMFWFFAEYCTSMGWSLEEVARANINKLKARYPDGFNAEKSLHRKAGDV